MTKNEEAFEVITYPNMVDFAIPLEGEEEKSFYFVWPVISLSFSHLEGDPEKVDNPAEILRTGKLPEFKFKLLVPTLDKNLLEELKDYLYREYVTGKSLEHLKFRYPEEKLLDQYEAIVRGRRPDGKLFVQSDEITAYLQAKRIYEKISEDYRKGLISKEILDRYQKILDMRKKEFEDMMKKFYGENREVYEKVLEILEKDKNSFEEWWKQNIEIETAAPISKLWILFARKWFETKRQMKIGSFAELEGKEYFMKRYEFVIKMYEALFKIVDEILNKIKIDSTRVKKELEIIRDLSKRFYQENVIVSDPETTVQDLTIIFPKRAEGLRLLNDILFKAFEFFL
ncbi:MAG: hypothetical protein ACP6IS_00755 [Candidatus Asgardarchaeia archaeon]